ncbi:MAG: EamA family transporter [Rhodobacteraceae bacterium]|nr:EamA family transporter [Paracoccaceae bacterium]RZO37797.1 MAG: DMT family transporter [Paracoccaceae bacterium]|tara:strand:+ start:99 stop:983 length:885 start_codon:yes stop_codon:yes gene_type:complete
MTKRNATFTILLGGFFMSFVGLMMKMIIDASGFQILFFRSMSLSLVVIIFACIITKSNPKTFMKRLDRFDLLMGIFLSLAFATYVFSMLYTSVASTLFILGITPFLAAIIAWYYLKEKPKIIVWITMIVATTGVFLMVSDGMVFGKTFGNILAFFSALLFAMTLVVARYSKKENVLGGTFLGGAFACLIGLIASLLLNHGLLISSYDMSLSLFMGAFTIGLGITLVTTGTPFVPAAEVSLLVLIESVLGPIWVWIFLSEAMTTFELVGGILIFAALIILARKNDNPNLRKNINS